MTHDTEIVLFEAAERYLKDVMQERFDPKKLPPKRKWEAARDKLKADRQQLSRRYSMLKDEDREVEKKRIYRVINMEKINN